MSMVKSERLDIFRNLDENGHEIPDDQPVSIPAGFREPESLADQIKRLVRSEEFQRHVLAQGAETFEESEDFDVDDDTFDPSSPYEEVFDPVLGRAITLDEFQKHSEIYKQRYLDAEDKAYQAMHVSDALRARPKSGAAGSPRGSTEEKDGR